jgi:hypothetical protein
MKNCTIADPMTTRSLMTGIGQTNEAARQTGAARTMRVCQNLCETAKADAPPEIRQCADELSSMGMIGSYPMLPPMPPKVAAKQRRTL